MIVKKLTLINFFRYSGKQIIDFATENNHNVTVIRGENGTGKTTLLNAFYWVLYGDVSEPFSVDNMLNYLVASKMNEGDKETVSAEIEFDEKGINYTMSRKQRYIKKDNKNLKLGETDINITYTNEKGNEVQIDDPELFFENIIPEKLRGFFFFDGERINRLAQVDGKDEIRQAILDILGLTTLNNINDDFEKINEELTKDLKKYLKITELPISDEYTDKIEEKRNLEETNKNKKDELSKAEANLKEINQFLMEHNSGSIKDKQIERNILENEILKLNKRIEENKKLLISYTSKNFKTYLLADVFPKVLNLLEERRKKGELPSDIKVQFINDLLETKRCICGRPLNEYSPEYHNVEELKKTAGRTELDDAYIRITSFVKSENDNSFIDNIHKYLKDEDDIKGDIETKDKKLKIISNDLKNSPVEKIKQYEILRENTLDSIKNINREIGKNETKLDSTKKEIEKLQSKLNEIELVNSQAKEIQKQILKVQKLGQLNNEIQTFFIKTTRENLDKKIKEVFSLITRKNYRIPVLTENFELKITSTLKKDNQAEVLSTGEGQITSLSFIGSLVSYSREKSKSGLLSDFSGGDFPIVMDSPFGNLDKIHTSNVAANIGKLASQVIIVVSDKQWNKEVEENIFNQVGKMYKMIDGEINKDKSGEYTVIKEVEF